MILGFVRHITKWHSTSPGCTNFEQIGHFIPENRNKKKIALIKDINTFNNNRINLFSRNYLIELKNKVISFKYACTHSIQISRMNH